MRTIKFRAWDVSEKRFVEVDKSNGFYLWCDDNGCFADAPTPIGKNLRCHRLPWTLLQFTGLHDKNGKEIYEGDVVKVLHGEWGSKHLGTPEQQAMTRDEYLDSLTKRYEVVFIQGEFAGRRNTGSYNPWSTDDEGNTYTRLIPDKHGYIEVIGNIYENPDLLTPSN